MILTDADELREALRRALEERDEARTAFAGAENSLTAEREHSARLSRECQERHDELLAERRAVLEALGKALLRCEDCATCGPDIDCPQCAEAWDILRRAKGELSIRREVCRATPLVTEVDK